MRRLAMLLLCLPVPALAGHPLITEDTGVLGKGRRQVELHGERSRDVEDGITTRTTDASAVLSYGAAETADLQVEVPHAREVTDGAVREERGDASVSVKWRFFERDGVSLVVKPELAEGGGWGLNLVAGKELGRFELLGHAGYSKNRGRAGERASVTHLSAALLYAATEKLKLVLDIGRDSNPQPESRTPIREVVYGLMVQLSDDLDFGVGYKKGMTGPADDRALLLGAKLRF
jgi:hypothetical protein